jgi:hypothetical protein
MRRAAPSVPAGAPRRLPAYVHDRSPSYFVVAKLTEPLKVLRPVMMALMGERTFA